MRFSLVRKDVSAALQRDLNPEPVMGLVVHATDAFCGLNEIWGGLQSARGNADARSLTCYRAMCHAG
jgi:hypothetical protein